MKRTMGGMVIRATAMVLGATELSAQRGPDSPRGFANRDRGDGVEMIMRMRAQLELSDDQIQELDAIRQESVRLRNADQAEMAELMSQLRAGEIDREAVPDAMEARAQTRREAADQQRERVDAILDETQRESLEEMDARARAFGRGYAMGMRGGNQPGVQSRRGRFAPGRGRGFLQRRGAGFAPGFGPGVGLGRGFGRGGGL